ncbi:unnamed protein product, partial [Meganyctiphanes norvegica]
MKAIANNSMMLSEQADHYLSTEVRHLPLWAKSQMAQILEVAYGWRELMARIPDHPWIPGQNIPEELNYSRKYTADDIQLVIEECNRTGRKGFEILLEEWGTSGRKRATLKDLMEILLLIKQDRAADYLAEKILNISAPSQMKEKEIRNLLSNLLKKQEESEIHNQNFQDSGGFEAPLYEPPTYVEPKTKTQAPEILHDESIEVISEALTNSTIISPPNTTNGSSKYDSQSSNNANLISKYDYKVLENMNSSGLPHYSYNLLKAITDNFSNVLHANGGPKLGEGAFGMVYHAVLNLQEGQEKIVAVKRLNQGECRVELQFRTEIEVLSSCCHKNLVPLEGYSCDGTDWCLVYTFMPGGSLMDRLAKQNQTPDLDWVTRLQIAEGSAEGIAYLHTFQERPLVHRDIKSANILLDHNCVAKVGDFGLVHMGSSGTNTRTLVKTTTVFGTSAYMAPEAFRGDISVKMDTFSYAIVLLELLTGLAPYDEERDGCDLLSHVQENEVDDIDLLDPIAGPWDVRAAQGMFDLVSKCTDDKRRRPTMVNVLQEIKTLLKDIV